MTGRAPVTAAGGDRTVHVEHCMGTVFSIDIRDPGRWDEAIRDVLAWLHSVDATFSTYRDDSDLSRVRRGELTVEDADPHIGDVLELCDRLETETGGYFTARWRDGLDPTGLVKGWAIERASGLLHGLGSTNHAINGGGDMHLAGEAAPGRAWRVGISDPHDRTRLLSVVTGRDLAIATSGTTERGAHILNPRTARAANGLASATLVGPSLTRADGYATAAVAMGQPATGWVTSVHGYEALLVTGGGIVHTTSGWLSLEGRAAAGCSDRSPSLPHRQKAATGFHSSRPAR